MASNVALGLTKQVYHPNVFVLVFFLYLLCNFFARRAYKIVTQNCGSLEKACHWFYVWIIQSEIIFFLVIRITQTFNLKLTMKTPDKMHLISSTVPSPPDTTRCIPCSSLNPVQEKVPIKEDAEAAASHKPFLVLRASQLLHYLPFLQQMWKTLVLLSFYGFLPT